MQNLKVSFNDISRYRSALMGIALMSVFCVHTVSPWAPGILHGFFGRTSGVDVFIFLSAIGLSFSLYKNPSVIDFYKRRLLRIFPTYWAVLTLIYLLVILIIKCFHAPDNYWPHPHNFLDIFMSYSTMGFWIPGELWYDWYIPSIILLYLLFPLLYFALKKSKSFAIFCLLPSFIITYIASPSEWYYCCLVYRIGVFIFGAYFFYFLNLKLTDIQEYIVLIVGFLAFFLFGFTNVLDFSNELIKEGVFYLLLPCLLVALCFLLRVKLLNACFTFLGKISLEVYLLHQPISRMMETVSNVLCPLSHFCLALATLIISIILALCIQRILKLI